MSSAPGTVRVRFAAGVAGEVDAFVRDASACCALVALFDAE